MLAPAPWPHASVIEKPPASVASCPFGFFTMRLYFPRGCPLRFNLQVICEGETTTSVALMTVEERSSLTVAPVAKPLPAI